MTTYSGTDVATSAQMASVPGLQEQDGTNLGESGGSAAVDWFQMLGVSATGAIYWKVSGSSDFAGASAPGPVTNVTLVRTWTV